MRNSCPLKTRSRSRELFEDCFMVMSRRLATMSMALMMAQMMARREQHFGMRDSTGDEGCPD